MSPRRLPFQGLNLRQWLNLIWVALFVFYISFAVQYVLAGGFCDYIAADYRAFLASAQIAHTRGFVQVYDLKSQNEFQQPLYGQCPAGSSRVPYYVVPMPYMPFFVLLFLPLVVLPYIPSYYVWVGLNLALLVLYMLRFSRAVGGKGSGGVLLQLIVCLPVFSNLALGQVNIWLLVGLGEFLLATLRGKEFRGGLWLGLLLLKPQTLILLLPGLLLKRRFKALAGFALATLIILIASILLVGIDGLLSLAQLLRQSSAGEATSNSHAEIMMNWRALAVNLGQIIPPPLAWGLAMAGLALTVLLALAMWLRPVDFSSPRFGLLLFATFAATFAATWHSHVHMVLPMIPLVFYLYTKGQLPWHVLFVWLLGPALIFPLSVVVIPGFAYSLFGLTMLALNLYLLVWAARRFWRGQSPGEGAPLPVAVNSQG